ncbi:MAG: response regulator transcription factor, partial [Oscillospiraceae bacterium]|nr:response regulator transcription factor [Oscillospiraceae bacterium]
MKILVIEDEEALAEALSEILKRNKYSVDAVYDGEDGLEYAMTGLYDCILLDIMLPKMNGLDVLRILRKKHISTPVLLLTAKSDIEDKITGLDSGADDFLTKPFVSGELLARVRALTRRKGEVITDEFTYGDIALNKSTFSLSRE